jgi:hypothetical protein
MNQELIQSYVNDPNRLLLDIDLQLEQVAIEDLPMIALAGGQQIEREVNNGQPKHSMMEALLVRSQGKLLAACCDQFGYCKVREKYSDTVSLVQAVGDSLLSAYISFPIPLITVASYCVLSMFLDRICDCP